MTRPAYLPPDDEFKRLGPKSYQITVKLPADTVRGLRRVGKHSGLTATAMLQATAENLSFLAYKGVKFSAFYRATFGLKGPRYYLPTGDRRELLADDLADYLASGRRHGINQNVDRDYPDADYLHYGRALRILEQRPRPVQITAAMSRRSKLGRQFLKFEAALKAAGLKPKPRRGST
ncbi:MAG: hypothetical protein PSU94_00230 [Lacunisphaera sp.]|nr:hypothetical protein [Lacunisphaera sp.]